MPGEGFTLDPGFPIATNQPALWEMAFSAPASAAYFSQLVVTSIRLSGADVILRFTSTDDHYYRVEYTDDTSLAVWNTVADWIPGNGDVLSITHTGGTGQAARFYRVHQLQ